MPELITATLEVCKPFMERIVFPIFKALYYSGKPEVHRLIGTGFFFDSNGLFLSAKHVFTGRSAALDREDAEDFAVYCVHSVNVNRKMVARPIDKSSIKLRHDTDIVAGYVEMKQFGKSDNSVTEAELRNTAYFNHVTNTDIPIGTEIWTVAYPLTYVSPIENGAVNIFFQSDRYAGKITNHHPVRRDRGMLNWPCYETDMEIKSGASGGPVFVSGSKGFVFGINCSSMDSSFSHVTSLVPLVPKISG